MSLVVRRIKNAEVAVLRKKIKKFNVITGLLLAVVTGASPACCGSEGLRWSDRPSMMAGGLGAVMSVISVDTLASPFTAASTVCICLYTAFFGIQILMFELSNSPKVNKYFRENYGFFMNFYGRAIFLFSVGFFAVGAGGTGVLSGLVAMMNGIFHLYVVKRNPQMKIAIKEADAARMAGISQGDDSGILTKVANMAAEDPNKLKATAQMGANMAQANPGMATAAMGMAAGGGGGMFGGGAHPLFFHLPSCAQNADRVSSLVRRARPGSGPGPGSGLRACACACACACPCSRPGSGPGRLRQPGWLPGG